MVRTDAAAEAIRSSAADELNKVESLLRTRNGRLYFECPIRKKEIIAKPEELVRQIWLERLVTKYGYPLSRLAVEYPITFGRDTSKRADIVIFDADRPTVPYAIIEVKQTSPHLPERDGIPLRRRSLSDRVRATQFLLPRHDCLRDPPQRRSFTRQARLSAASGATYQRRLRRVCSRPIANIEGCTGELSVV